MPESWPSYCTLQQLGKSEASESFSFWERNKKVKFNKRKKNIIIIRQYMIMMIMIIITILLLF